MNGILIKKVKWFWAWQDDKEEAWLGEMAQQGLHLSRAGYFGQYTFQAGKPRNMVYRLDFVPSTKKTDDYFQLFRDAGWEYVGAMGGWQYWRNEIVDGKVPEIFTDSESKIQKYRRLIGFLTIFIPIFLVNLFNYSNSVYIRPRTAFFTTLYDALNIVMVAVYTVFFVSIFMIARRIAALRRD